MITPAWVQLMARYNAEMNRRWYTAADTLDDAARKSPQGAFFGSLHGTLCHLVWADRTWMSRFSDWTKPPVGIAGSAALIEDYLALRDARFAADERLIDWAAELDQGWLDQDLVWFSGAAGREMRRPRNLLVAHMFNHQTHHRGQAHALLTRLGAPVADTDLDLVG